MKILAIDPGTTQSAFVVYENGEIHAKGIIDNNAFIDEVIQHHVADKLYIEMVASYGMAVGKTVFETCVWIGRFIEAWESRWSYEWEYVYRKDEKMTLCNSMKAKDSNIRQALIDRFGGDKQTAIGTKKNQGPLYGVKKDIWAALAVAVTADERAKSNLNY